MVLTGRAALLALVGAGVVGLLVAGGSTAWVALLAVNAALLVILVLDAVRATSPRDLALARSGDRKVRLGQVAHVGLEVTNTGAVPASRAHRNSSRATARRPAKAASATANDFASARPPK